MNNATVLIFGSGGREAALAWKIQQSPYVQHVIVAPGNIGMTYDSDIHIRNCSLQANHMLALAKELQPDLIVIGPEQPLVDGVADLLKQSGFLAIGPHQAAAQLEASKIFSKEFMTEFEIPTADYVFYDSYKDAVEGLNKWDFADGKREIVIKSDELAGGKGVVLCDNKEKAQQIVFDFMENSAISVKTQRILFEKKIRGREISAFALFDGQDWIPMGYVCDYKRVYDHDMGPNTGGMGSFVPNDIPDEHQKQQIYDIFERVNRGMIQRGTPYVGILFAGLMIEGEGKDSQIRVLEFNIRFGDPETQSLLPTLDGDIFVLFYHCANGTLQEIQEEDRLQQNTKKAVHVVLASQGYPSLDSTKHPILTGQNITWPSIQKRPSNTQIFFAGVRQGEMGLENSGGRVLGVTCVAESIKKAREGAYQMVQQIHFEGMHYRRDIAKGYL